MIGKTISHYRVLEKLGAGGMGQVFRAYDERLDRDVAVKVLAEGTVADDSSRTRLRREAIALAKLSHPNIGMVHDFGTADGVDFIVMEYVPGVGLDRKIASSTLPEEEVTAYGGQIAAALAEAHDLGVIHCDLKPSNIVVTPKGQVKVLDFGLARLVHPVLEREVTRIETDSHEVAGTLPYMSPEQLRGERIDARTDLYALGVVLYEIATGERPFIGPTAASLTDSILHSAPTSPLRLRPSLPAELERIILKCLEKDPGNRYQSAKEVEVDLRRTALPAEVRTEPLTRMRFLAWGGALTLIAFVLLVAAYIMWPRPAFNSVAVMPFDNATGDPGLDYLGDGIAEELINGLTQVPGVKVIARPTAFSYKGSLETPQAIGRALSVRVVVMGRIAKQTDQVAVQVDVIDTSDGAELWGGQFRRRQSDIHQISSDIVRQTTASLRLKLTGEQETRLTRRSTQDPEAYLLYLRGRSCLSALDTSRFPECIDFFEQALEKDASFAQALAGLADAYAYYAILGVGLPREYMPQAREAAMKALQIDDTVADAHTSLGIVKLLFDYDFTGAELELRRAMELNPGDVYGRHWYAHYLEAVGRMEEANAEMKRISELDPLSSIFAGDLAFEFYLLGQYEQVVQMSRGWTGSKNGGIFGWVSLALSLEQLGRPAESLQAVSRLLASDSSPLALGYGAAVYARIGRKEEAQRILEELEAQSARTYVSSFLFALVHVALGNNDRGLQYLAMAFEERNSDIALNLAYDPQFDPIRQDPRFVEMVRRYKLPEIRHPK